MYSKNALENRNKATLVDLTMDLQSKLADATSGPLSSGEVKKRLLSLSMKVASVADNAKDREEQHEVKLAEIAAQLERDKKESELKYAADESLEAEELQNEFAALEAAVERAKKDLSYGLEQAEADAKIKLDELDEQAAEAIAKLKESADATLEKLNDIKEEAKEEIADFNKKHSREMADLKYDAEIAVRDQDLGAAEKIADKHDMVVIKTDDYEELRGFEATDVQEVDIMIKDAVANATAEMQRSYEDQLKDLKASTDNTIALLDNDKKHLVSTVETQEARIADLSAQLKEVPKQLAEAVGKAKAAITVNQDAAKK